MLARIYHSHWIAGRANISVNIKYTYFFNFGHGFWGSFSTLFLKAPGSCGKKIVKIFLKHCASICMTSKYLSQTFKILFQTGDINIFVLSCVFFSRYIKLKSFFSDEEKIVVKSETYFSREVIKN